MPTPRRLFESSQKKFVASAVSVLVPFQKVTAPFDPGYDSSTIEGHLGHFIRLGELDIFTLMPQEQVEEIEAYFREQNTTASAAAKAYFGDKYSYGQLKMVLEYMNTGSGAAE